MAKRIIKGQLVGVVDGPAIVLSVKGQEQSFALGVDLPIDWVQRNMDKMVTVLVEDGRVTEVM